MKIVVLDGFRANPGDLSWEKVARFGEFINYDRTPDDEILSRIGDAEVVLTNKTPLTRETLEKCPNMKLVVVLATGYNVVDTKAAAELGIIVTNIPSYSSADVAQLAIAFMLEIALNVGKTTEDIHNGRWCKDPDWCYWDYPLIELEGLTLGIIGYGNIGKRVGAIANALGMKVVYNVRHHDPSLDSEDCHYVDLEELYAVSDIVTIHCPETAETRHMINKDTIAKMKDGVIFINTSRGGIMVEQDIADALKSGKIYAAGIDALEHEPMKEDCPLLNAPNCYITGHIGWQPKAARERLMKITEANIEAYIKGNPINKVN